jgi:Flp pilus assembly protein CpaB
MKTQTVAIFWVSVAICLGCLICGGGLVASYLTSQLVAQRNKTAMLVVAKHDYAKGTTIADPNQMFELREFREIDAPQAAVTDLDERLRGMTLRNDIHEGQPLQFIFLEKAGVRRLAKLDPPGPGKQHFPIIAKGREESVKVGTRVDVIQNQSKEDAKVEKTLLHNALISSAKPRVKILQKKEGKKDSLPRYHVTLEISDEEAKVLQSAIEASLKDHELPIFELRKSEVPDKKGSNSGKARFQSFSVTLEANQVQGGFVVPGCYVDCEVEINNKMFSKMAVENVQVRGIDQTCNLYGNAPPPTYFIRVNSEQARILQSYKGGRFVMTIRKDNFNANGEPVRF